MDRLDSAFEVVSFDYLRRYTRVCDRAIRGPIGIKVLNAKGIPNTLNENFIVRLSRERQRTIHIEDY